jgi:hypothetical protein
VEGSGTVRVTGVAELGGWGPPLPGGVEGVVVVILPVDATVGAGVEMAMVVRDVVLTRERGNLRRMVVEVVMPDSAQMVEVGRVVSVHDCSRWVEGGGAGWMPRSV